MTGIDILRAMMTYIWPKGNPAIKLRVITALSLLVGAKVSEAKSGAGHVGGKGARGVAGVKTTWRERSQ